VYVCVFVCIRVRERNRKASGDEMRERVDKRGNEGRRGRTGGGCAMKDAIQTTMRYQE